jgi:glutamyl-tRNA reductase
MQEEHQHPADLSPRFATMSEIVLLTTCNRIELYAHVSDVEEDPRQLMTDYLTQHHQRPSSELYNFLYYYDGQEAAEHLIRVACGLESQILGEPQILGQVTGAYMNAVKTHAIGPALNTLFRAAIRAGKRARASTSISSNPASIASVSINLADQLIGPLNERQVLVIGLGEMAQLAINALRKRGVRDISIANRTLGRAEQHVQAWNGIAYSLEQLPVAMDNADLVITATASQDIIVSPALVKNVMQARPDRELVMVDIALPRDVHPQVREIDGVDLFNMDDLRQSLDRALEKRRREIPRVEAVIAREMKTLQREFRELSVAPVIVDLRQKAEAIRQHELQRTLHFLGGDVDPQTLKQLQHLSRSLVNKILHEPTVRLRQSASNGQADAYASTVCDLFDLDVDIQS